MRGFSLLELMIAIAITAFLAVAAAPALNYLISYGALNNARTQINSALQLARSEAIRRGERVRISPLSATASDSNEFGTGLVVWFDNDNDNSYDAGEEIFEVSDLVNVNINTTPNVSFLSFSNEGRLEQAQDKYSFEICKESESEGYVIEIVSRSGSVTYKNKNNCAVSAPADGTS